jgi:hypothetical protein
MGLLMKKFIGLLLALVVIFAVIAGFSAQRFVLLAKSDVAVDSYPFPGPAPVAKMQAGERATVLSCDDLKSYPTLHVRLKNGMDGYVIDGSYKLIAASIWDSSSGSPIVFFCPKY